VGVGSEVVLVTGRHTCASDALGLLSSVAAGMVGFFLVTGLRFLVGGSVFVSVDGIDTCASDALGLLFSVAVGVVDLFSMIIDSWLFGVSVSSFVLLNLDITNKSFLAM
jgi:hypothetical protein